MKKIFGIFIIVLISIGIADFLQGIILTLMYTPNSYTTGYQEMETIITIRYFSYNSNLNPLECSQGKEFIKRL